MTFLWAQDCFWWRCQVHHHSRCAAQSHQLKVKQSSCKRKQDAHGPYSTVLLCPLPASCTHLHIFQVGTPDNEVKTDLVSKILSIVSAIKLNAQQIFYPEIQGKCSTFDNTNSSTMRSDKYFRKTNDPKQNKLELKLQRKIYTDSTIRE